MARMRQWYIPFVFENKRDIHKVMARCECQAVMLAFKMQARHWTLENVVHRNIAGDLLMEDVCEHGNDLPVPWIG